MNMQLNQNLKKNSASQRKNPNHGGLAGLEPAAPRRTTRPNPDDRPLQLVRHRLTTGPRISYIFCVWFTSLILKDVCEETDTLI